MYWPLILGGLAILQTIAAIPIDAAKPAMNHRNLTMPDGTVVPVQLPPGIQFIPRPDHGESASDITKRLSWHRGNGDICKTAKDYAFVDKTTKGSPLVSDCEAIVTEALDSKNQGYFQALKGGDLRANGDWCRLMYRGTCVFGIKSKNIFGAKVGSEDIGNTINDALKQPEQRYDRMQWEGTFKCKNAVDDVSTVHWAIFHS